MLLKKLNKLDEKYLESIGFSWHTNEDSFPYISDNFVCITQEEAENFYSATNELYDMFVSAAQYVIDNNLFHELGIPFNLIDAIKLSWENDVHWHLYGRFDLAGGIDGKPIKLIEFNADTPTSLFETSAIQWEMLRYNKLDEQAQFNNIYDSLVDNFKRLITLNEDTSNFEKYYDGWKILFSCVGDNIEDEMTVKFLQSSANDAGFDTNFCYADEVEFSDENGIFYKGQNYEYWFKLIPWESIAIHEGEMAMILKNIMQNQKAIILNPAYTLIFQSKGILKILWDLYPNHPLLLESSFKPLNKKMVKKPFLGREGSNITILDKDMNILQSTDGEYDNQNFVYQEFYDFNSDNEGYKYQAGVFFAYEASGLGFRKSKNIIDNYAHFVGHIIS